MKPKAITFFQHSMPVCSNCIMFASNEWEYCTKCIMEKKYKDVKKAQETIKKRKNWFQKLFLV